MKDFFAVPNALQICMDDIGWFVGHDKRAIGLPSSTGMPRKHHPLDYKVVNEIGKAIGMKIMCPLVIGEWDKDNLLTKEVGITYQPYTWDRASKIDMNLAQSLFEEIENSDYIEIALHGLLHGNYDEKGKQINELEYFDTDANTKIRTCQTEELINHKFDLFFKIYESWNFTKKIRSFAEPGEPPKYVTKDDVLPLANALKKRNINYWTNYWIKDTVYFDSILYIAKSSNLILPWNAYDIDPAYIRDFTIFEDPKDYTILGMHWTNFLRFNPENNLDVVSMWVQYFKKQSEIFGLMISKDIAFAGNQRIYRELSETKFENNTLSIDVSKVYEQPSIVPFGEFYLSIMNEKTPKSSVGCEFEVYEKHNNFITYKIKHTSKILNITF